MLHLSDSIILLSWVVHRLVKLAGYLIFVSECESGSERSRDKLVKVLAGIRSGLQLPKTL